MTGVQKLNEPASAENTVSVTAHRKITVKYGDTYESFEGSIQGTEPRDRAPEVLQEWLQRLDQTLEAEKNTKIAKAQSTRTPTPTKPFTTQQAPSTAPPPPRGDDTYFNLPWKQSQNKPNLGTMRVSDKLPPLGRELYEKLKQSEKKRVTISGTTYRLSVTQRDSEFVPKGTEYLQRWT
jgi:hypothetical protein